MASTANVSLNYGLEAALGNVKHSGVTDVSALRVGRNPSVGNGAFEGVWAAGGAFNFLQAAETVRVRAGGNVNDTLLGTGARQLLIGGVTSTGSVAFETIDLAGASASANSTNSYWRLFDLRVTNVGTFNASNTGDITVESSSTNVVLSVISAGIGQSQLALGATGLDRSLVLTAVDLFVESNANADFRIKARYDYTNLNSPPVTVLAVDNINREAQIALEQPIILPPSYGEIWVEAQAATGTASVTAVLSLAFITNP